MVNEYIQNGKNAPILPCGSAECSMIEYMNPGSTKAVAEGVDVVGIGEIQGAATDILAATRDANVKSAADALGEDLAATIAEIQSTLDTGRKLNVEIVMLPSSIICKSNNGRLRGKYL